jgi:hypothetical protein
LNILNRRNPVVACAVRQRSLRHPFAEPCGEVREIPGETTVASEPEEGSIKQSAARRPSTYREPDIVV